MRSSTVHLTSLHFTSLAGRHNALLGGGDDCRLPAVGEPRAEPQARRQAGANEVLMIETMIHVWGVLFVCLCRSYSPTPAVQRPSLRHKVRAFGLNAREQLSPTGAVQTPNTPVRQERLEAPKTPTGPPRGAKRGPRQACFGGSRGSSGAVFGPPRPPHSFERTNASE